MSKPPVSNSPRLMQFFTDEVHDPHYVDLLLARVEAAGRGKSVLKADGGAYHVTFGPQRVVIEHHYPTDWLPLYVPREDFIIAARRWRLRLMHGA
jgi:hypothetical protein